MAIVCCFACRSHPKIFISASFVPSFLVGYRKVYSGRREADVVMSSSVIQRPGLRRLEKLPHFHAMPLERSVMFLLEYCWQLARAIPVRRSSSRSNTSILSLAVGMPLTLYARQLFRT